MNIDELVDLAEELELKDYLPGTETCNCWNFVLVWNGKLLITGPDHPFEGFKSKSKAIKALCSLLEDMVSTNPNIVYIPKVFRYTGSSQLIIRITRKVAAVIAHLLLTRRIVQICRLQ